MAITVKVLERPVGEVSYLRATIGGLVRTFRHMVNTHKVTVQYPETRESVSPRWRGTHRMLTTEDGHAKCVACGLCPTVCPANCIKLVPGEAETRRIGRIEISGSTPSRSMWSYSPMRMSTIQAPYRYSQSTVSPEKHTSPEPLPI